MKAYFLGLLIIFAMAGCSSIEKEEYFKDDTLDISTTKVVNKKNIEKENFALEAAVIGVTDGDTLEMKVEYMGSKVPDHLYNKLKNRPIINLRLIAVDTPESTKEKQIYGEEATEFVKELVEDNRIFVELDPKADFDKYGRLLGHVYTEEGHNLQSLLLSAGLARTAYLFDEYKYINDYKKAEAQAKREELNIHSIDGYVTDNGFNMDVVDKENEVYHINNISDIINLLDENKIKDPLKFISEFP